MINNDVLRSVRYILDVRDDGLAAIIRLGGAQVSNEQVSAFLANEDDPAYRLCDDRIMSSFLDGLVTHRRGARESAAPRPVDTTISNNIVLKKLRVAFELNDLLGYTVMWTADRYYSLLLWLTLGMGGAFEFPLLVVLAVYMGLIEVATLRKYRRHAIVVIFIIAAIVTPTPDPLNQALFAVPLIILYEVAIFVAALIKRRRKDEVVNV